MGVCGTKFKRQGTLFSSPTLTNTAKAKCIFILNYNFDRHDFKPLKEFQDVYTELLGNFILPGPMSKIVLEFKRFIMLHVLTNNSEISPSPIVD